MTKSLSQYFSGIGAKRLTRLEVQPHLSNQHEFNGIYEFREIFGTEKKVFHGTYIYLAEDSDNSFSEEGILTWYDARANHPTRTEYRLYYNHNTVISSANPGDLVIIGKTVNEELVVIVSPEGSTPEQQMKYLFGLEEIETKFVFKNIITNDFQLNFSGRYIMSTLGIEVEEEDHNYLEEILKKFDSKFPTTAEFSAFARNTIKNVSPIEEPDQTIIRYLEQEELLFRTLEKHIVEQKLKEGFGPKGNDVDEFVKYSLSVQNRRKSRAGHSFENHLASIFLENNLRFSKGQKTERNNKPDFLFPDITNYHQNNFNVDLLTMLGVKTTAKDRWRQVLSEAEKIPQKHLITLEPAISVNQTDEMKQQTLQLVIPSPLFNSYSEAQQKEIITLADFINLIKEKEFKFSSGNSSATLF